MKGKNRLLRPKVYFSNRCTDKPLHQHRSLPKYSFGDTLQTTMLPLRMMKTRSNPKFLRLVQVIKPIFQALLVADVEHKDVGNKKESIINY
jgi:hypothetical protein